MYITRFVRRTNGRDMRAVRRPGRTTKGAVEVAATQPVDLSTKTKAELVDLARAKGLDTEGNKADIVERLGAVH